MIDLEIGNRVRLTKEPQTPFYDAKFGDEFTVHENCLKNEPHGGGFVLKRETGEGDPFIFVTANELNNFAILLYERPETND